MKEDADQRSEIEERAGDAFRIVALAASAGGLSALGQVLSGLPSDFPVPIVIVQHLDPRHRSLMAEIMGKRTSLEVKQAEQGDKLQPGRIYIAPPDHHLLVNKNGTLSLSQSELVQFVRPSADLLIDSMAAGFGRDLIGSEIIPDIVQAKSPTSTIRLWSAGCATGKEAYSLAILMAEAMGIEASNRRGQPIKCVVTKTIRQDMDGELVGLGLFMEEERK